MPKPQVSVVKRQREQAKRERQQRKAERRAQRKSDKDEESPAMAPTEDGTEETE